LRLGLGVSEILRSDGRVSGVRMADNSEVGADVLVLGLGVVPATDWLAGSGLEVADGVVCDGMGRTNRPGVFAVGDVARWTGPRHAGTRRMEHWTSATEQADAVSAAILGEQQVFDPIPYWWSDQYDLKLQGLGWAAADDDLELLRVGPQQRLLALYSRDGRLTGAVGFSAARAVMRLRGPLMQSASLADAIATVQP